LGDLKTGQPLSGGPVFCVKGKERGREERREERRKEIILKFAET
jgi:hypothetical protein